MQACTYTYQTPFQGFGKSRALKLANPTSQAKSEAGEKIAYRIHFTGHGLTMNDLWIITKVLAKEVAYDLRKQPLPDTILRCRRREIGERLRYDDSFIFALAQNKL